MSPAVRERPVGGDGPVGRVRRRDMLGLSIGLMVSACARRGTSLREATSPPPTALHIEPLVGLVPSAGLAWLVLARPVELWANPVMHRVTSILLPTERFEAFAATHGGMDFRRAQEAVAAGFEGSSMVLVRAPVRGENLVSAFSSRAVQVVGRASEGGITHVWGTSGDGDDHGEELVVFGDQAAGWERGRCRALRAAALFARRRLRRARAAFDAEPLSFASIALGDAPIRAFAPGPFVGGLASGLGGLLGAATAVAASLRPTPDAELIFDLAVFGAWERDGEAAADRLTAVFDILAADSIGHLLGVDRPITGPRTWLRDGAIRLEVTLEADAVAHGLHSIADATIDEIMAY